MPIASVRDHDFSTSLVVIGFVQRKITRACRWSCRFSPTPGSAWTTGMPKRCSSSAGPTPESCSSCGDCSAPAARITSRRAFAVDLAARLAIDDAGALRPSNAIRVAWASVSIRRFARACAGRR